MWLSTWTAAQAQDLSGVAELRWQQQIGVTGVSWQITERVRPEFTSAVSDRVSVTATVDVAFSEGRDLQTEVENVFETSDLTSLDYARQYLGESAVNSLWDIAGCDWPDDPPNAALGIGALSDYASVDRLYVDAYLPGVDLRIGRQPVQWGSAQLVNPTDPFPEVLFVEPWRFRRGLNAARATVPVGKQHQVQFLLGTDDAIRHERLATRGTLRAEQTEVSAVAAWRGDTNEPLVGADLRSTLGVGFWVEGALHLVDTPYEEVAVGVDYSFPVLERLYVMAQYYRNGSGAAEPAAADGTARLAAGVEPPTCADEGIGALFPAGEADPFAPLTTGRDYALAAINAQITTDFGAQAAAILNTGDGSGVVVPTVSVAALPWLEFSATGQIPFLAWGDSGEFRPADDDLHVPVDVAGLGVNGFDGADPIDLDFSGLRADAAVVIWTRATF
jgi:hypothetical protein